MKFAFGDMFCYKAPGWEDTRWMYIGVLQRRSPYHVFMLITKHPGFTPGYVWPMRRNQVGVLFQPLVA